MKFVASQGGPKVVAKRRDWPPQSVLDRGRKELRPDHRTVDRRAGRNRNYIDVKSPSKRARPPKIKDAPKRPWFLVEQNMEVKGTALLYTLAGLMITFAGFSALLLGLRQAAGARLSLLDRYLAKTVMTYIFVLTAGALMPPLFALYDIQEKWIWRCSAVLFALPMLSLQVTYPLRRRKVVGKGPPPAIYAVLVVFGSIVTLAMLGCVLEGLQYSAAAYITGLTIDFFTVVFGFVIALDVIMQQPTEMSDRPAPH